MLQCMLKEKRDGVKKKGGKMERMIEKRRGGCSFVVRYSREKRADRNFHVCKLSRWLRGSENSVACSASVH